MLTVFKILFFKYSGQPDIIIGTPVSGRDHADLGQQVGFYLNTLVLRTRPGPADTFETLLNKVKEVARQAYEHQVYPFDELVDELGIERDISRHPVFNVMIDMINFSPSKENVPRSSLEITPFEYRYNKSKYDLVIYIYEGKYSMDLNFEYNVDLFEEETITHMADCFRVLIKSVTTEPAAEISHLDWQEEVELFTINPMNRKEQ
jgi:non-ribosomal peptide synthetase component F